MKKISVIVPCYNEEATIELFHEAITKFWESEPNLKDNYELELQLVNDGSKDRTADILKALADKDTRVHYTSFSRNFGKEAAIFCGLKLVTGDAAVVIDADLQHPVETIKDMVLEWEKGFDIVEGRKEERGKESGVHKLFANMFYGIISRLTGFDMKNSSDFKLIDRKVIDALNDISESETFFRAMSFWVGFKSTTVSYTVNDRVAGESKWSTRSLIRYAFKNITSFTYSPLYIIMYLGIIVLLVGIILGIDAIVTFFKGSAMSGYPSLIILIVLATGAILLSLGVIAVYIAKIYQEVKARPRYIIGDKK